MKQRDDDSEPAEATAGVAGLLLVLSGPAGVGKDTVWQAARTSLPGFAKAITCTTRAPRAGEVDGVHYYFVSAAAFDRLIESDALLEWAWVHDNRYGVPVASVNDRLRAGLDVVCIIEVQGALKIREQFLHDSLLVYLTPPVGREAAVLSQRMGERGTESDAEIARRLQTAAWELEQTQFYDYVIVNDDVAHAAAELCAVIEREKERRALAA